MMGWRFARICRSVLMAVWCSSPASVDRLSHLTGMDRQVWKESKGAKGTQEVSIQKGSKGARGTYLPESTGSKGHSHPGEHRTNRHVRGVERIQGSGAL